jgi:hypothetical protein
MSDQTLAILLTVVLFALMAAWVPFLDLVQHIAQVAKTRTKSERTFQSIPEPASPGRIERHDSPENLGERGLNRV